MPPSPEYTSYILEQLNQIHPVTSRKMFGGVGIFIPEGMFAMITSDNILHFKADDENRADYETAGMTQFRTMPYYELPGDILDSRQDLEQWMEKSMAAAQRANKAKKK